MELQTEYLFHLPRGYVDREGNIHREGIMRLGSLPIVNAKVIEGLYSMEEYIYSEA